MHKKGQECPGKYSFPVDHITGEVDLTKGRKIKEHSDECIKKSNLTHLLMETTPSAQTLTTRSVPTDVTMEMHAMAEELALAKTCTRPEIIYWEIKRLMDKKYVSNWYGMKRGM
jgi:hypothetical protein